MFIVPATYFSTAIRHAQQMPGGSADSISLVPTLQLRTAYDVLAADAENLQSGPVSQISGYGQAPFGCAPSIDLSRLPSREKANGRFGGRADAAAPSQDAHAVNVGVGQ